MGLRQKSEPLRASVFDMYNLIDSKGYTIVPFRVEGGFKFLIVKEGIVVKTGVQRYEDWKEGERIVLNKLTRALGL